MIKNSKQTWEVSQTVNVGFIKGLTVIAKVPTPGDSAPDAYVLARGDQFYSFVPHCGISKIDHSEARAMVEAGKRHEANVVAAAAQQASKAIAAAALRAELMGA